MNDVKLRDITNFIALVCAEASAGGLIAVAWCAAALLLEVDLCMYLAWFAYTYKD